MYRVETFSGYPEGSNHIFQRMKRMPKEIIYRCVNCGGENDPKDMPNGHCKSCEEGYEDKRELNFRSRNAGKDY